MLIPGFGAYCYFDNLKVKIAWSTGNLSLTDMVGGGGAEMIQMISLSKNTFSF